MRKHKAEITVPAVKLAREAMRACLSGGEVRIPRTGLPKAFERSAGVFVTISKKGQRRGCKGSLDPACATLKEEIARAAVGAATGDIRYRPLRLSELNAVTLIVSIVGPAKRVKDASAYSPRSYGLLLKSAGKSGVVLPGEAKTSAWRLAEARRQAGVARGERYEMYVFETVELREPTPAGGRR